MQSFVSPGEPNSLRFFFLKSILFFYKKWNWYLCSKILFFKNTSIQLQFIEINFSLYDYYRPRPVRTLDLEPNEQQGVVLDKISKSWQHIFPQFYKKIKIKNNRCIIIFTISLPKIPPPSFLLSGFWVKIYMRAAGFNNLKFSILWNENIITNINII